MKKIIITEDVRFQGVGFTPGDEPLEVADEMADALVLGGFAKVAEDDEQTDKNSGGKKP